MAINTNIQDLDNELFDSNIEGYGVATSTNLGLVTADEVTSEYIGEVRINPITGRLFVQVITDYLTNSDVFLKSETYDRESIETMINEALGNVPAGNVDSVNGYVGTVVLSAIDILTNEGLSVDSALGELKDDIDNISFNGVIKGVGIFNGVDGLPDVTVSNDYDLAGVYDGGSHITPYLFYGGTWEVLSEPVDTTDLVTKTELETAFDDFEEELIERLNDIIINVIDDYSITGDRVKYDENQSINERIDYVQSIAESVESDFDVIEYTSTETISTILDSELQFVQGVASDYYHINSDNRLVIDNADFRYLRIRMNYNAVENLNGNVIRINKNSSFYIYDIGNGASTYAMINDFVIDGQDVSVGDVFQIASNMTVTIDNSGTFDNRMIVEVVKDKKVTIDGVVDSIEELKQNKEQVYAFTLDSDYQVQESNIWENVPCVFAGEWSENTVASGELGSLESDHIKLSSEFSELAYKVRFDSVIGLNPSSWQNTSIRVVAVPEGSEDELLYDADEFTNAVLLAESSLVGSNGKRLHALTGVDLLNYSISGESRGNWGVYLQINSDNASNEYIVSNSFRMEATVLTK